jgi:hypothetical protein
VGHTALLYNVERVGLRPFRAQSRGPALHMHQINDKRQIRTAMVCRVGRLSARTPPSSQAMIRVLDGPHNSAAFVPPLALLSLPAVICRSCFLVRSLLDVWPGIQAEVFVPPVGLLC